MRYVCAWQRVYTVPCSQLLSVCQVLLAGEQARRKAALSAARNLQVLKAAKLAEVPRDVIDRNLKKASDKQQAGFSEVRRPERGRFGLCLNLPYGGAALCVCARNRYRAEADMTGRTDDL